MAEYIDTSTHEILDDDDMHDRYDEWINDVHGNVSIGNATFSPSDILKELDPIAYRAGFSDFIDYDTQDGSIMELDDSPVCEECGEDMSRDEVILALEEHGTLFCQSCEEDWEV